MSRRVYSTLAVAAAIAGGGSALAEPITPRLEPVIVESVQLPPDRTRTEEQAREDIERTPGGVAIVPRQEIDQSRAANSRTRGLGSCSSTIPCSTATTSPARRGT